jgi:hypothetical protein
MSGAKLEADRGVHGVQEVVCIVPADRPENLPDDTSLDTFFSSCSPGNSVLPPASATCEEGESDSDLVEALIGIMPQCLYHAGITEADYLKAWPHSAGDEAGQGQTELELLFAPALVLLGEGWQSKLKRISGYIHIPTALRARIAGISRVALDGRNR